MCTTSGTTFLPTSLTASTTDSYDISSINRRRKHFECKFSQGISLYVLNQCFFTQVNIPITHHMGFQSCKSVHNLDSHMMIDHAMGWMHIEMHRCSNQSLIIQISTPVVLKIQQSTLVSRSIPCLANLNPVINHLVE